MIYDNWISAKHHATHNLKFISKQITKRFKGRYVAQQNIGIHFGLSNLVYFNIILNKSICNLSIFKLERREFNFISKRKIGKQLMI
jgi:hypothetical protein